jgi:hypothetical protein
LCLPTTPIFIINDMLSSLTIEKCSELFCYMEDNSQILKSVRLNLKLKIIYNFSNKKLILLGSVLFKRKKLFTQDV